MNRRVLGRGVEDVLIVLVVLLLLLLEVDVLGPLGVDLVDQLVDPARGVQGDLEVRIVDLTQVVQIEQTHRIGREHVQHSD